MNRNQTQDNGKQMTGKASERKHKLTQDDLTVIARVSDQLSGVLRGRCGSEKAQSEE